MIGPGLDADLQQHLVDIDALDAHARDLLLGRHNLDNLLCAAGVALGVDRLVMGFFNATKIDEMVAFTPEEL